MIAHITQFDKLSRQRTQNKAHDSITNTCSIHNYQIQVIAILNKYDYSI